MMMLLVITCWVFVNMRLTARGRGHWGGEQGSCHITEPADQAPKASQRSPPATRHCQVNDFFIFQVKAVLCWLPAAEIILIDLAPPSPLTTFSLRTIPRLSLFNWKVNYRWRSGVEDVVILVSVTVNTSDSPLTDSTKWMDCWCDIIPAISCQSFHP